MQAGAGFMVLDSDQEKIATVLFEYEKTKKALAQLRIEARRIGEVFQRLNTSLAKGPESLHILGQSVAPSLQDSQNWALAPDDIDSLREIAIKAKKLDADLKRLTQERADLGYPV